jgi:acyl-coenzyme A synthetase/AMP-(fatty) acid ligase
MGIQASETVEQNRDQTAFVTYLTLCSCQRFKLAYMEDGVANTSDTDAGMMNEDNFCVRCMSRTSDVINVAGHRLKTRNAMEVINGV